MNENLHISEDGMKFIANYEGCYLTAYDDLQPRKKLKKGDKIIGTLTIGYGHVEGVYIGQTITQKQAWDMFKNDLAKDYELRVKRQLKVEVSQTTFDALCSRAYNVGNVINVAKAINKGDYNTALKLMEKPNTSKGIVLSGLTKRRLAEKEMLRKGLNEKITSQQSTEKNDEQLFNAVSKIIKSRNPRVNIDFNCWKSITQINKYIKYFPNCIMKITNKNTYESAIDSLVENGIISNVDLWMNKKYNANHISSLLIKYSNTLK